MGRLIFPWSVYRKESLQNVLQVTMWEELVLQDEKESLVDVRLCGSTTKLRRRGKLLHKIILLTLSQVIPSLDNFCRLYLEHFSGHWVQSFLAQLSCIETLWFKRVQNLRFQEIRCLHCLHLPHDKDIMLFHSILLLENFLITPSILTSLLTSLSFLMLHTRDPSFITDKLVLSLHNWNHNFFTGNGVLPCNSHLRSWHHYL